MPNGLFKLNEAKSKGEKMLKVGRKRKRKERKKEREKADKLDCQDSHA